MLKVDRRILFDRDGVSAVSFTLSRPDEPQTAKPRNAPNSRTLGQVPLLDLVGNPNHIREDPDSHAPAAAPDDTDISGETEGDRSLGGNAGNHALSSVPVGGSIVVRPSRRLRLNSTLSTNSAESGKLLAGRLQIWHRLPSGSRYSARSRDSTTQVR